MAAVATAVVLVVAQVRATGGQTKSWAEPGHAFAAHHARFEQSARGVELKSGQLVVSAWAGPVEVWAGGRHVTVDAAVASVQVAADRVEVTPLAGAILLDGQRLEAPTRDAPPNLALPEPADVSVLRASRRAQLAEASHRWGEATEALAEVGRANTLAAEAALTRKGELELTEMKAPERALETFEEAGRRFPQGSLNQERSLSSLEALAALHRWPEVTERAKAFVAAFPESERRVEVQRLEVTALLETGHQAQACAMIASWPVETRAEFDHACAK